MRQPSASFIEPPSALPGPDKHARRTRSDFADMSGAHSRRARSPPPPIVNDDEMRIHVHGDGAVEFSVKLGSEVDAEQLAQLVAAVRQSAGQRRPPQRNVPRARSHAGDGRDEPNGRTSPPLREPVSSGALRLAYSPRQRVHSLADAECDNSPPRDVSASSGILRLNNPRLSPGRLPDRALPGAPDPHDSTQWDTRSVSTPDLRADRMGAGYHPGEKTLHDAPSCPPADAGGKYGFPESEMATPGNDLLDDDEQQLLNNWQGVEYELTEKYRGLDPSPPPSEEGHAQLSAHRTFHYEMPCGTPTPVSTRRPWRIFSNLGARLRRTTTPSYNGASDRNLAGKDSTCSGSLNPKGVSKLSAKRTGKKMHVQQRARDDKPRTKQQGPWLEFETLLSSERTLAELARFAKTLGFQVWRRPGENKLRCIRVLNARHEMHLVVVVEPSKEAAVTTVKLRRGKGDRGRTEWWRFSHFHRDVVARFAEAGLAVSKDEEPPPKPQMESGILA